MERTCPDCGGPTHTDNDPDGLVVICSSDECPQIVVEFIGEYDGALTAGGW